jgi:hypothetical protein
VGTVETKNKGEAMLRFGNMNYPIIHAGYPTSLPMGSEPRPARAEDRASDIAEQIKARDASANVIWTPPAAKPMKTREEIESKLAAFERWLEIDAQRFEPDEDRVTPLNAAAAEALRWVLGREAALEP